MAVRVRRDVSPILTYHACYRNVPEDLKGVHNVHPGLLQEQLSDLKAAYSVVPLDEFAAARDRRGLAAITFDDAYSIVLQNAVPILLDLELPVTIFVAGGSLEGRVFWRDKVRFIQNHGLEERWERFSGGRFRVDGASFYHYTKNPVNNTQEVDEALSAFLGSLGSEAAIANHCFRNEDYFFRHQLVTYGNHTHNHYALSSLTEEQQRREIQATHDLLAGIPGIQRSRVLSVPFGHSGSWNQTTLQLLGDFDYCGLLLNRQRLNPTIAEPGLATLERFTASPSPIRHQIAILERSRSSKPRSPLRKRPFDPSRVAVCMYVHGERTVQLARYCLGKLGFQHIWELGQADVADKWETLCRTVAETSELETIIRIDGDILVFDGLLEALENFARSPFLHWCKTVYCDAFKSPGQRFNNGCPDIIGRDVFLDFARSPLRRRIRSLQKPSIAVMDRGVYGGLGRFVPRFASLHDYEQWPSKVCQTFVNKRLRGDYPRDYAPDFLDRIAVPYRRAILESERLLAQHSQVKGLNYLPVDLSHLDEGMAPIEDSDLPALYETYVGLYREQSCAFRKLAAQS